MNRHLCAASALALAAALAAAPAYAATLQATPASVWPQVSAAAPGDTVQLQAGDYGALNLWAIQKAGEVVITPAPGAAVKISQINADSSTYLTFRGLAVTLAPTPPNPALQTFQGTHITFDQMTVTGPSCSALDGLGASFRNNPARSALVISNSTFTCLGTAIAGLDLDGITIVKNAVTKIQTDGIILTGVTNAAITDNSFAEWHNAGGGHPDAIQWAASSATGNPSSQWEIARNTLNWVAGSDPTQFLFGSSGTDFYVHDNVAFGPSYYGLNFADTTAFRACHNYFQTLTTNPDLGAWVMVRFTSANGVVAYNGASAITLGVSSDATQPTNILSQGNTLTTAAAPGDLTQYNAWLAATPTACPALPGSTSTASSGSSAPPATTSTAPTADPLQPQLDAANAQVTTLTSQLQFVTAAQAAAATQVASLTAQVSTLKTQLAAAQASATASQVKSLQSQLSTAQASLTAATSTIAAVKKAVGAK